MKESVSFPLDPQLGLLAACALAPPDVDLAPAFARYARDARGLVARAQRLQVRPQLATHLRGLDHRYADDSVRELHRFTEGQRGRGLLMAGEALAILDALRADGIAAVPFKGPAFATFVGQGPGTRETNDLDFIIEPRDIPAAVRVLGRLGYSPILPMNVVDSPWLVNVTPELGLVAHDGTTLIELHWRLSPHWYPACCSVGDVMASLTARTFFHGEVLWPCAEELLLVHISDGLKSCGNGLRWIADIAHILRRHADLDWRLVRAMAAHNQGLRSVCIALCVVDELASDIARHLGKPGLEIDLHPEARSLAGEVNKRPALRRAAHSIRARLVDDVTTTAALPQFHWAMVMGDRPARAGAAIVRHVTSPTINDLSGAADFSGSTLRLRALRRRVLSRISRAA